MGTPGQQKAGCWLALLCTCCICPSLQQGSSRIDPKAELQHTGHAARDTHPVVPTPLAGSHPGLEVRITSQEPSRSLPAGSLLTQGLSNPPARLWSRLPSPGAQPALCPQCQAQGEGAPCMSMPVMVFPPSPFPKQPGGVHQPRSNLAPGGDPSASSPCETLPTCCRDPRQAHGGDDTCSTHCFQLYLPGLQIV